MMNCLTEIRTYLRDVFGHLDFQNVKECQPRIFRETINRLQQDKHDVKGRQPMVELTDILWTSTHNASDLP